MEQSILLLGDPRLYEISEPVVQSEVTQLKPVIQDLHDTLMAYRKKHHAGRAIAAPQIGIQKRVLYMHIEHPTVLINPVITFIGDKEMTVLDDCMSFPNLLVKVKRHYKIKIAFRDMMWQEQTLTLEGDLSELLQHEYDHLDGILATMRAIDNRSLYIKE
ncbi:MAG: peptide deformylase [Clostridiales bacterium]|jgi:peptide deformylase|nr:peptide deformylase [Clostridiales bacterium]